MNITCIQMNMAFAHPDENYKSAAGLIKNAAEKGTDVVVLPETWNTGFFPKENLSQYCDRNGERVKTEVGSLALKYDINIVAGSVANIKNNKIFNTSYVFDRNGVCVAEYDKTHLFTPMGEDRYFEKGESFRTFNLDGRKCGIIICYDLRFPEISRRLAIDGIEILFVVSQWPKERIEHYITLSKARAVENQMFVVCCNSCSSAYDTVFGGNSCVIDPFGKIIVRAGESQRLIDAEIDFSLIDTIRKSMNVFTDRRTDLY